MKIMCDDIYIHYFYCVVPISGTLLLFFLMHLHIDFRLQILNWSILEKAYCKKDFFPLNQDVYS